MGDVGAIQEVGKKILEPVEVTGMPIKEFEASSNLEV